MTPKIEIERQIICDLILTNGKFFTQIPFDASDFDNHEYQQLFGAITEDIKEFGMTSIVSIHKRIKYKASVLSQMISEASSCSDTISHHIKLMCQEIISQKKDIVKQKAIKMISNNEDVFHIANYVSKEIEAIESYYGNKIFKNDLLKGIAEVEQYIKSGKSDILYTGFKPFDDLNYGIIPEEYIFIAARPSIGKTAFLLQLLCMLSERGIKSGFFSLEMSARAIVGRLLSSMTQQDTRFVIRDPSKLSSEHKTFFLKEMGQIKSISQNILTSERSIRNIKEIFPIAKQMQKEGAQIIVVDYVQLLTAANKQSREQDVSEISRGFKLFSKETKLPFILLSQLSRDCEKENRYPKQSDLRESGSLEQDADCIYFLAKKIPSKNETIDPNHIMLIKTKGRNTGVGIKEIYFNKKTQSFTEIYSSEIKN